MDPVKDTAEIYEREHMMFAERFRVNAGQTADYMARFVDMLRGPFVLDVGCASGDLAARLCEKGCKVTGIDLSHSLIRIARERAPAAQFKIMDMRNITEQERSYDGIWSASSLIHIPKRETPAVMQGFYRILKPEGIMFLGLKEGAGESTDRFGRFIAYYSQQEASDMVKAQGLEIIDAITDRTQHTGNWVIIYARR